MNQQNDKRAVLRLQLAILEAHLRDYRLGHRIAVYDLPDGQRRDETPEIISQLERDIDRLRNTLADA